jgi:3-hydroxy-D-aspartate aldolase
MVQRQELATPALLVDLEILEHNTALMFAAAQELGVGVRPHAKAHKSPDLGRMLLRAGAIGASCATIEELDAMASGGVTGLLLTAPLADPPHLRRLADMLARGVDLCVVCDSPAGFECLRDAAAGAGQRLAVLVDVDVGMGRTGCVAISDIVALARRIADDPHLVYRGIQAYWGNLQQGDDFAERSRRIGVQVERVRAVTAALTQAGLAPEIVSGAGTGSYLVDAATGLFTEIQPGSFLFMDSCYCAIDLPPEAPRFAASLFVVASVVSATRPGRVIVNAGFKAFATDSGKPVPVHGVAPGARYSFMGDEHGAVDFEGDPPVLGATIEFITSHCDPTVNLYPCFHVVSGEEVVDTWGIAARYGD